MDDQVTAQKSSLLADMKPRQLAQVILIGALLGVAVWGLTNVLGMYVFKPVVCANDTAICSSANQYAMVSASLVGAGVALTGLVKLRVFRPLLVVIAATVSLWGISSMVSSMPWYGALLASTLFYALAYAMYAWIVRIRMFWIAILLLLVLIVATRLILTSR